jgi:hypothetical protein
MSQQLRQLQIFADSCPNPLTAEKSYFNTTKLSGDELKEAKSDAKAQERNVLELFKKYSPMSPSTCWGLYKSNYDNILLTSCRRAITTLTKSGALTKTNLKVTGAYGAKEFVWKIS